MTRNVRTVPARQDSGSPAVKALADQQVPGELGRAGEDVRRAQEAGTP